MLFPPRSKILETLLGSKSEMCRDLNGCGSRRRRRRLEKKCAQFVTLFGQLYNDGRDRPHSTGIPYTHWIDDNDDNDDDHTYM
jgi:hypothetical protein